MAVSIALKRTLRRTRLIRFRLREATFLTPAARRCFVVVFVQATSAVGAKASRYARFLRCSVTRVAAGCGLPDFRVTGIGGSTARTSSALARRHCPGARPARLKSPMRARMRRRVGWPTLAVMRRTWRFFPSRRVSSSQLVGMLAR